MRILISGFEGFGHRPVNPTAKLIERLPEITPNLAAEVRGVILPVTFDEAFAKLEDEIRTFQPDVVVAFGLAAGRSNGFEIERVAINCRDAEIPDNKGQRASGESLDPKGVAAYFTTLPLYDLVRDLRTANVPAKISNTAGTYVCNALFYHLQAFAADRAMRTGFIHVPDLPETAGSAGSSATGGGASQAVLPMETLLKGVRVILQTLVA